MNGAMNQVPDEVARIGRAVRVERHRQRLTQQELADRVGCSAGHLSRFESGHINLSLPAICKFAKALGVSFEYLVCPMEDPERERLREPWPERAAVSARS